MTNQSADGSSNAPSCHPATALLLQVFQFLCERFGVDKEVHNQTSHFSDVPREWYIVRLRCQPVEIAFSHPLSDAPGVDPGQTWEKYAVLKIGELGSLFAEEGQEMNIYPFVEILAGPFLTPHYLERSSEREWDIRPDSFNELSRLSVGSPAALVAYTCLAGISTLMLQIKELGVDHVLSNINLNQLPGGQNE